MNLTPEQTLRQAAATVRNNPEAREAIAQAFEAIADMLLPCLDCDHPDLADLEPLTVTGTTDSGV